MKNCCDLHAHSVFSDGTYTPARLIDAAEAAGLSAIALCDHNTVDGLPDFLAAAEGRSIQAVPGAEFSVDLNGTELHLLGFFIPPSAFSAVSELMDEVTRRKDESNAALVASLNEAGYTLDYSEIKARSPKGKINRAHIGAALTEKGYTSSITEAFQTLLSPAAGHYREPERLSVWDALDFLGSIHAVPVLAHPFLNLKAEELTAFLPAAKEHGLLGMEVRYSLYSDETTVLSEEIAAQFGLLPSGGSDFHGSNKPDISLGTGKGNLFIPAQWAEALAGAQRQQLLERTAESILDDNLEAFLELAK